MSDPTPSCRIVPSVYVPIATRVADAQQLRDTRAAAQAGTPVAQPCNGDETEFPQIANFSKSLQHDNTGVVTAEAYAALQAALTEQHVCSFDQHLESPPTSPTLEELGTVPVTPVAGNILKYKLRNGSGTPVGNNGARLVMDNPLAAESFSLEGADPQTVGIYDFRPPAPGTSAYPNAVLADSPIAYYRLDDTGSTLVDSSGHGLNGTYGSAVTHGPSLVPSTQDPAAVFPGGAYSTNSIAQVPINAALQPSTVTVEAWVTENSTSTTQTELFSYGTTASGNQPWSLRISLSNVFTGHFETAAGIVVATGTTVIALGTPYYVVGTWDGTTASIYVNGVLEGTSTSSGSLSYASIATGAGIGGQTTTRNVLNGSVDEAAVYSGALSAARIAAHYAAGTTLETGYVPAIISFPAPPKFNTKTELSEIVENYYMALLRDVPFKYYTAAGRNADVTSGLITSALASQIATLVDGAVADLGGANGYYFGQNYVGGSYGMVTEQTLFRGFTEGDRIGPYVSQFFVRPVPVGRLTLSPKLKTADMRTDYGGRPTPETSGAGRDYLTIPQLWFERQQGYVPKPAPLNTLDPNYDTQTRLIRAGRDAGEYVHADVVFQEYFNACFILFAAPTTRTSFPRDSVYQDLDPTGAALPFEGGLFDPAQTLAPEIPYQFSQVEKGFITLGNHDVKSMIGEVARRALLTVWYYKWNIHRRLRPEEFAGRIEEQANEEAGPYPFYANPLASPLTSTVLPKISALNSTNPQDAEADGTVPPPQASYLLPQQFPEGCPIHPAYGAGHATTAGACVTLLKAFFNDDLPLANLKRADSSGNTSTYFVPVQPAADGLTLQVYTGADAAQMTLGGELNKLASNVSLFRNIAGVHWRSDHTYSLLLGEAVAIDYLLDIVNTYSEEGTGTDSYANLPAGCDARPPLSFTLRTFEGYRIRIAKSSATVPAGVTVIEQPPAGSHDLSGIYNPVYT